MKPIIGITVDCVHDPSEERTRGKLTLHWNYAEAVSEAGGVPVVIPPTADPDEIIPLLDGWLIPGGDDIDASHWDEENHPKSQLQDPARYAFESELLKRADKDLPIFGICYGCQFLNVAHGGSLHQHLPDVLGEDKHTGGVLERNTVDPNSKLAKAAGSQELEGKSYHHQAISKIGKGLTVTSKNEDGTVEAIEAEDRDWTLGVQWHPERHMDEAAKRLFKTFVERAAAYRSRKDSRVGAI